MAKVIGQIDSLTSLLATLKQDGIREFQTLTEIINFNESYRSKILELEESIRDEILNEIESNNKLISSLNDELHLKLLGREKVLLFEQDWIPQQIEEYSKDTSSFFNNLYYYFKRYKLKRRLEVLQIHFDREKRKPFVSLEKRIKKVKRKVEHLNNIFDLLVRKRLKKRSKYLQKTKRILDKYSDLVLGAIGEARALEELKRLPESYTVINGFKLKLKSPYYKRKTDERIISIQADHIVIGPSGVFLIETKNWSKTSINNPNFYSPMDQITRSGYTLYRYLNDSINNGILTFFTGIWTKKKVSVRNIVLMINSKPMKTVKFVKILGLHEVNGYITYFDPIYDEKKVNQIIKHLT